jgi:hypothetical protein
LFIVVVTARGCPAVLLRLADLGITNAFAAVHRYLLSLSRHWSTHRGESPGYVSDPMGSPPGFTRSPSSDRGRRVSDPPSSRPSTTLGRVEASRRWRHAVRAGPG